MTTPAMILTFWFEQIPQDLWWKKDTQFDAQIRKRYGQLHRQAAQGELADWRRTAKGRLAEIIILDQFSRNMYRDTPQAFAQDSQALVLAQEAVARQADKSLAPLQRLFLYMPYMHSESLLIHDRAVELYEALGLQQNLDYEYRHREIIERFGRYPHRNSILGRPSSAEELAFLEQPGSSF